MPKIELSHPNSILFATSWNQELGKVEFTNCLPSQALLSIEELEVLGHCILKQAEDLKSQSQQ